MSQCQQCKCTECECFYKNCFAIDLDVVTENAQTFPICYIIDADQWINHYYPTFRCCETANYKTGLCDKHSSYSETSEASSLVSTLIESRIDITRMDRPLQDINPTVGDLLSVLFLPNTILALDPKVFAKCLIFYFFEQSSHPVQDHVLLCRLLFNERTLPFLTDPESGLAVCHQNMLFHKLAVAVKILIPEQHRSLVVPFRAGWIDAWRQDLIDRQIDPELLSDWLSMFALFIDKVNQRLDPRIQSQLLPMDLSAGGSNC